MLSTHLRHMAGIVAIGGLMSLAACGAGRNRQNDSVSADASAETAQTAVSVPEFSADSAMAFLRRQVEFGPRVPNTEAHRKAGDWMVAELKRRGAEVHEQTADLTAFDGTVLKCRNIFARFNPQAEGNRLLLMAHYDTRPWADQDPDAANHKRPIDGANDGGSGVAVILETARHLAADNPGTGIDILLSDAEDYGATEDEDSWALGARYFAQQMHANGWTPTQAILLDMVGGRGARFPYEYFSRQAAPALDRAFRKAAVNAGYGHLFPDTPGSAVTDDHIELIKMGVPAIDIIEYDEETGFNPTWHTMGDNIGNIDPATLKAVGQSLLQYIYENKQ